ncbi:MAG: zinc-binding alcohol dehydrogenase [Bacillota bacterium]|nr:zinc-binding alcohol dehydrogenase [Bacillota bacterium]
MDGHRIVFTDVGQASCQRFSVRTPAEDEVLIETEYSVLSAGTERANLLAMPNTPQQFPAYPGYCAVGRVTSSGPAVSGYEPGCRVIVYHGGHQSHTVMKAQGLVKVEQDKLDPLEAAFTVIASMSMQGLRKVRLELGESIMIMGQGLLGIFATQLARLSGGLPVMALDFNQKRRELAVALGADYAFQPDDPDLKEKIMSVTRGKGINAVIEVTGSARALEQALALSARQGRVSLLGCTRVSDKPIDFYQMVHKPGLSIIGAHNYVRPDLDSYPGYWTRQDDYRVLLDLMATGRLQVKPIISEVVSPRLAGQVYARLAADPKAPLGVVFDWFNERFV